MGHGRRARSTHRLPALRSGPLPRTTLVRSALPRTTLVRGCLTGPTLVRPALAGPLSALCAGPALPACAMGSALCAGPALAARAMGSAPAPGATGSARTPWGARSARGVGVAGSLGVERVGAAGTASSRAAGSLRASWASRTACLRAAHRCAVAGLRAATTAGALPRCAATVRRSALSRPAGPSLPGTACALPGTACVLPGTACALRRPPGTGTTGTRAAGTRPARNRPGALASTGRPVRASGLGGRALDAPAAGTLASLGGGLRGGERIGQSGLLRHKSLGREHRHLARRGVGDHAQQGLRLGSVEPLPIVLAQQPVQHRPQLPRLRGRVGALGEQRRQRLRDRGPLVGRTSLDREVEGGSERPDVGLGAGVFAPGAFRGGVAG